MHFIVQDEQRLVNGIDNGFGIGACGARLFLDGDVGKAIVAQSESQGGHLIYDDLKHYRVELREPLYWRHAGALVALNPPPALEQYMYIIASTNEATLRNAGKREALIRYCQGIAAALKAMQSDRAALKAWADKWFEGLPPQIAEVSFEINSRIFFDNPQPRADLFQKNVDFINAVQRTMGAELLPASVTFEAQYDPSLVTEALGRG